MNNKPTYTYRANLLRITAGIGFILLGILFLIGRYAGAWLDIDSGHYTWPFFIITPGLFLFLLSFGLAPRPGIVLAAIGIMVTTTGTILLVQNTFDLFASWAYAWALVAPTSIGLAKLIYGGLHGLRDQVKSGATLTGIGLAIFVMGAIFFELAIGINGFRLGPAWLCWPGLLIGLGFILLLSSLFPRGTPLSAKKQADMQEDHE